MKDIQTAILPLSVVLCLCGFGVFEYPQNQPRFCFTIFYILISWLFYAYIAFKMAIFLRKNELTYTMFHYSNMIFAILYMLSNFYYNKVSSFNLSRKYQKGELTFILFHTFLYTYIKKETCKNDVIIWTMKIMVHIHFNKFE